MVQAVENRSSPAFEPTPYVNTIIKLFDHLRTHLGDEVELLHDVHERIPPIQAINLAKGLEPYNLFFLEDPFAPEDVDYFQLMRQQTKYPYCDGRIVQQSERVRPSYQGPAH